MPVKLLKKTQTLQSIVYHDIVKKPKLFLTDSEMLEGAVNKRIKTKVKIPQLVSQTNF